MAVPAVAICTLQAWPPGWGRELQESFWGVHAARGEPPFLRKGLEPGTAGCSSGCGPRGRGSSTPTAGLERGKAAHPGTPDVAEPLRKPGLVGPASSAVHSHSTRAALRGSDPTFYHQIKQMHHPLWDGEGEEEMNCYVILFKTTFF